VFVVASIHLLISGVTVLFLSHRSSLLLFLLLLLLRLFRTSGLQGGVS
jgi:hypothetical protein